MFDLLISICLLFVCIIFAIAILYKLVIALKSYKWEKTVGIICKSKKNSSFGWIGSGLVYTDEANLKYRYRVNGKKYRSGVISPFCVFGINGMIPSHVLKKYPKGKSVKVYYSPHSPENSCLEPGIGLKNPFTILSLIMGLTLLAFTFQASLNMFLANING